MGEEAEGGDSGSGDCDCDCVVDLLGADNNSAERTCASVGRQKDGRGDIVQM